MAASHPAPRRIPIDLLLTTSALCRRMCAPATFPAHPADTGSTDDHHHHCRDPGISRFTPQQLLRTARLFATDPELASLVDAASTQRQEHLLDSTAHLQIWLLVWPPGTATGWHDHHASAGALHAVTGVLTEHSWLGGAEHERLLPAARGGPSVRSTCTAW